MPTVDELTVVELNTKRDEYFAILATNDPTGLRADGYLTGKIATLDDVLAKQIL